MRPESAKRMSNFRKKKTLGPRARLQSETLKYDIQGGSDEMNVDG